MSDEVVLTDENSIICWCARCNKELRVHLMFPLVRPDSLTHECSQTIPTPQFEIELLELKPYDIPVTKLLDPEWRKQEWEATKAALRKEKDKDE